MKTDILPTATSIDRDRAIAKAVELLRAGAPVALPTETVYGLAADALDAHAVAQIFDAKDRPRFDPLIVHVPDPAWLEKLAAVEGEARNLIDRLREKFWPGPLTFVLPRRPIVPDLVTAGLETVALRWSAHPLFAEIIQKFARPLAAPSANRFGRLSPTEAKHVALELEGRIPLIVDGGPATHGVESTIVAVRNGGLEILRHGPVTAEMLSEFAQVTTAHEGARVRAPGQLPSHYAPRTPLVLTAELRSFNVPEGARFGALSWRGTDRASFAELRTLSANGDLREAAANLFRYLRELDGAGLDLIVAEEISQEGLGAAIMDRLRRAARRL